MIHAAVPVVLLEHAVQLQPMRSGALYSSNQGTFYYMAHLAAQDPLHRTPVADRLLTIQRCIAQYEHGISRYASQPPSVLP